MNTPPADILSGLAKLLEEKQEKILEDFWRRIETEAYFSSLRELAGNAEHRRGLSVLFRLFLRRLTNPADPRCYSYIRQLIADHFWNGRKATDVTRAQVALEEAILEEVREWCGEDVQCLSECTSAIAREMNEVRLVISESYSEARDQELRASEEKYRSLLAHASEAIFVAELPGAVIVEANLYSGKLTGRPIAETVGTSIEHWLPPLDNPALWEFLSAPDPADFFHSDEGLLTTTDHRQIPVGLSASIMHQDGNRVVQLIVRDLSAQRELQRHEEEHTRELEEQVAIRTREVAESQEEYRKLLQAERSRTSELAMLNEVARLALEMPDLSAFLRSAAEALQRHYGFYDVVIFLLDRSTNELVLRANVGAYERELDSGYRQKVGVGMVGWAAEQGATLLANDVSQEPRRILAFPQEERSRSELSVPIKSGAEVLGVLDVQSQQINAFSEQDVLAVETLADQMAGAIERARLNEETHRLAAFNEHVVAVLPYGLMALDPGLRVLRVDDTFAKELGRSPDEITGRHISEVVDRAFLDQTGLLRRLKRTLKTGEPAMLNEVRHLATEAHADKYIDVRIRRAGDEGDRMTLLFVRDVTTRARRTYQLRLMHQVSQLLQQTLDLQRLIHATLTCVTAGSALGLNRAFLFLYDDETRELRGTMAVGPSSHEEASRIWRELGEKEFDLEEIIANFSDATMATPLQQAVSQVCLSLEKHPSHLLARVMAQRKCIHVTDATLDQELWDTIASHFELRDFVVAPLVAGNRTLGVVFADNKFSGRLIEDSDLQLLGSLAAHAGLAIANARAHMDLAARVRELAYTSRQLREAQERVIQRERLATIGEMAAKVSHEIRTPLATIGGFARTVLKVPEDPARVEESARIIAEEVARLEDLLRDMLDYARQPEASPQPENVNPVIERACLMVNQQIADRRVSLQLDLGEDLPEVSTDARQVQQALLNIVRNAVEAVPAGGEVKVSSARTPQGVRITVADNGPGMPPEVAAQIFSPFQTTKHGGAGLGLFISRELISQNGGSIEVETKPGKGTRFVISLPFKVEADPANSGTAKEVREP